MVAHPDVLYRNACPRRAPTIAFTYDSVNPSQSVAITVAAIRPNSRSCKGWRSGTRPDLDANSGWRRLAIPSSILARRPACPRLRHFPLPSLESACDTLVAPAAVRWAWGRSRRSKLLPRVVDIAPILVNGSYSSPCASGSSPPSAAAYAFPRAAW